MVNRMTMAELISLNVYPFTLRLVLNGSNSIKLYFCSFVLADLF